MLGLQSCGITVLRVVVGIVFAVHGYQKLFTLGIHGVSGMVGHLAIHQASDRTRITALRKRVERGQTNHFFLVG